MPSMRWFPPALIERACPTKRPCAGSMRQGVLSLTLLSSNPSSPSRKRKCPRSSLLPAPQFHPPCNPYGEAHEAVERFGTDSFTRRARKLNQSFSTHAVKANGCFRVEETDSCAGFLRRLRTVGDPDVFHLNRMIEEPAAFSLFHVKPVNGAAFVGEHLLQIAHR